MEKCPKCGCFKIDEGRISGGPDNVAYSSKKFSIEMLRNNMLAEACMKCGYLEIYLDSRYLKKLNKKG